MIQPRHLDWIDRNYPTRESAYGSCAQATSRMVEDFPELRRARGFYRCPFWGERTHWWCVDPDGSIVDPTAHQFPSFVCDRTFLAPFYEELIEGVHRIPTGRCQNCGGWVYDRTGLCSEDCRAEWAAYCKGTQG